MRKANRLFAFLLVAAMVVTLLPLASFAKSTALNGKTIVAFGDSLTRFGSTSEGGSTSSTGAYTYPYYLGTNAYLGTAIINAGVGGDTTGLARARFETDVLAHNPELVIICLGMNDQAKVVSSGEPLTDLNTYRANLTYFAETLKARDCDVVFVTPNPVNTNDGYYTTISYGLNYAGGYLNDFCNAMREVAIAMDCTLVDINYECAFEDMDKFCAGWGDGIHHSDYGRKQYANYISKHLEAVYDGTNKAVMTVNCVDENGKTLKTYNLTGASGAHITVASPEILGYSPVTADIQTTFVNGATFTLTYSFDLNDYIDEAMNVNASEYNEVIIAELRSAVAKANELIASGDATTEELLLCSDKIEGLLAAKGAGEYIASANKSYTASGTDHANYKDDGKRLTDGIIGKDGGSNHSGWTSKTEVTVDLGEATSVNTFRAFLAGGQWGITYPASLTVSYSVDGESYTEIGADTTAELMTNSIVWDTYSMTVTAEAPVKARYVKFSVAPNGNFVWLGEVQASLAVGEAIEGDVYVTGFNKKVGAGDCIIFTPEFGTVTGTDANHIWTANVIAEWSETENAYVVKSVSNGTGASNTPSVTLSENEIMIAAHDWESGVTDGSQIAGSAANVLKVQQLVAGDVIVLDGIDANNQKFDVAPYIYIEKLDVEKELAHGVVENPEAFWVTHYNDMSLEGVGVICTGEQGGAAWWISVAFKPVDGYDNVYEVVEKSDGTANGKGVALNVPEGGFVWSGNYGNNYPALYASNPTQYAQYADATAYPNYTNAGAQKTVNAAKSWNIGDKFVIEGIDFEFKSVPSSTPGLNWFDAGYVSTATINVFNPDAGVECEHEYDSVVTEPDCENGGYTTHTCSKCGDSYVDSETEALGHTEGEWETLEDGSKELRCTVCGELLDSEDAPVYETGDVTGDGKVNMFDYILIKSIYLDKVEAPADQVARADLTGDGKVNMFDYIALKSMIIK